LERRGCKSAGRRTGQSSVFVPPETVESGSSRLENDEVLDSTADGSGGRTAVGSLGDGHGDDTLLLSVPEERVRVSADSVDLRGSEKVVSPMQDSTNRREASRTYIDSSPLEGGDLDVGRCDVVVPLREVQTEVESKQLRGQNVGTRLGVDVDGVLD
jgi:hypothetical protein